MALDNQSNREIEVFASFAEVCPFLVVSGSIQKRDPPEPDIMCEINGQGGAAFELVELIDEEIARRSADTCTHRQEFNCAIANLGKEDSERFNQMYRNAFVKVTFHHETSIQRRKKAISGLIESLLTQPAREEGEVELMPRLQKAILCVHVRRGSSVGPIFDDSSAYAFSEPARVRIMGKLKKKYCSTAPIELLAYYGIQPVLPRNHWFPSVENVVEEQLHKSQFRRVWIFDCTGREILLVRPSYP